MSIPQTCVLVTATAPSTRAAVPIALGDGGQAESSDPRNECRVRWLCDLRRHGGAPKAPWHCSCCRLLGPDLLGAEQRSEALDPIGRQRGELGAVVFEPCGLLAGLGQDETGFHDGGGVHLGDVDEQLLLRLSGEAGPRL